LRKSFNRKIMSKFDVGGMEWESETDAVFDEFLMPSFNRLSVFYQNAARLDHHVIVFYQ